MLNIENLILMQEKNMLPLNWCLRRVARLFYEANGIPRVADIDTDKGYMRQSLVRLWPLPTSEVFQGYSA